MQNSAKHIMVVLIIAMVVLASCASNKVVSAKYYFEHEQTVKAIEQSYKKLYKSNPFSVEFTDKSFNYISIEMITDSLKYIYEFEVNETRLLDTLTKYHLPAHTVVDLIQQMRSIRCIWINNLDYYSGGQKDYLVFMSFKPVAVQVPFTYEKYFILTFYSQPQYYDEQGRLLVNRRVKRLRKINEDVFRRINDKVCYTISEKFR